MVKCKKCGGKISKLMVNIHKCRCKGIYCKQHLHDHDCTFNYNKVFQDKIAKDLAKVEPKKVVGI